MPTLFRVGAFRIVVYYNDHPPPHVHAVGDGHARFALDDTIRDITLEENHGIVARDLHRIAREIGSHHEQCLAGWKQAQARRRSARSDG